MALIDDTGRRITNLPKTPKPRPMPKSKASSGFNFETGPSYSKPKGASSLPGWYKEVRAGSDFMPMRIKPASYTSMAQVEGMSGNVFRPRAYQPVTVPTPPTETQTTVGNMYFKPTEDVAAGVKKEWNLWQDIKNLGGKVIHKGGSLLMGALDVLSRPRYALMNVFQDKLQRHYTTTDSAGGADVTGGEVFKGILGMLNPLGLMKDAVSGDLDDVGKAAWAGLSGQKKTSVHDILNLSNPEFVKEHPLAANIGSIVGDIAFDPVTWLTMGLNPGSIGRAGAAGTRLAMGDKNAAARLWSETLFTKTGRAAGVQTVKRDIWQKEMGRLQRQGSRAERRAIKADKKSKPNVQALKDKHDVIVKKIEVKAKEDLKGADLAWKIFKKSLPTAGIMTMSRLTTGAGGATAMKGAALLKTLHSDFNLGVAEDLSSQERWHAMFAANKGEDFEYWTGGEVGKGYKKTIKLSEAKNVKDFIFKVSSEANPIASYAEHGTVAARARKSHIVGVESNANTFKDQFFRKMNDNIQNVLTKKESKAHSKVKGLANAKAAQKEWAPSAKESEINDSRLITLKEEDFDKVETTYENLRAAARKQWKAGSKGKKNASPFNEKEAHVLYEGADGTKKIKLSTLKEEARRAQAAEDQRHVNKVKIKERTPTQKSVDQMTGVSDDVAAGRARLIEAGNRARVARELHAAMGEENAAYQALHRSVAKSIDDSPEFTDIEKGIYHEILRDTSKPLDERIAEILKDRNISNSEANEILEDSFKVSVSSDGTVHASAGGTIEDIPKIIQAVIKDRFATRITGSELENAGTTLKTNPDGSVQVVQHMPEDETVVHYTRDLNTELGSMILDGYRAAAEYARQVDLYQNDPEILFDTIHKSVSEFMNLATADTKRQVIQAMYNMTGMRLPEKFVPSYDDVARLTTAKEHIFTSTKTGKPLARQDIPWESLGVRMQTWVIGSLKGIVPVKRLNNAERTGYDMDAVKAAVIAKAADINKPLPGGSGGGVESFTTSMGSVYAKNPGGGYSRTRSKAIEDLHGQTGESKFDNAYFIAPEDIDALQRITDLDYAPKPTAKGLPAIFVDERVTDIQLWGRLKKEPGYRGADGRVLPAKYVEAVNAAGGKARLGHVPYSKEPVKGHHPYEVNKVGRSTHIGHEVTEIKTKPVKETPEVAAKRQTISDLLQPIWDLRGVIEELPINGTTEAVNKYSFLDFFMHGDEILKAQGSTIRSVDTASKGTLGRINYGRLSALDSFTFVDDEAKKGLEALGQLKKYANGSDPELKELAQRSLASMFYSSGGLEHIDDISMPASGSLKDIDFGKQFNTLGAHARLKESSLRKGPGIETGHSVQLLDSMWGKVTVNHELQKAFQNAILHNVWVKGQKENIVAEQMAKGIDDFFAPYDNIKKALYPVRENAGKVELTGAVNKATPTAPKAGLAVDAAKVQALDEARQKLKVAIANAKQYPNLKKAPEAAAELAKAREEYVSLLKAHDNAATPPETVPVGAGENTAVPDPAAAPEAPTGTDPTPTGDPSDFNNFVGTQYTPEEIEAIRKWIGITNNMNNPEAVARQVHAHTNAVTSDMFLAQQKMMSDMADLTIRYGASVRFMGIPFMPMFNPMNPSQTMAGVVAFDQYQGSVNKFYKSTIGKFLNTEKGKYVSKHLSRPSKYLEGGLHRIMQTVVNSVGESRKYVIALLDNMYDTALGAKFDSLPQVNGMGRKQKLNHFKQSMFKPTIKGAADPLKQYQLADGTNPVHDIANNFGDSAKEVFVSQSGKETQRMEELKSFNQNIIKDYRLSQGDLESIMALARKDDDFAKLMPYSVEWLREVGQLLRTSPLSTEKLLKINLGKFHYAMQDAKLKYHSGRLLNHGVFEQFAFKMDPSVAAMHNKEVVGSTVDVNGKPLRGPVVPLNEKSLGATSEWGIDMRHVPEEFLDKGYYISSDILPDINTLFSYMDETHAINDTINVGFLNKVLAYFKQSVTIYKVPSYPIRNLIGDVFMSAFDGLVNPRYYKDAARLQMDYSKAMERINTAEYKGVFDDNFLQKETLKAAHDPSSVLGPSNLPATPYKLHLATANGPIELNGSQVMEAYYKLGLGQNRVAGEIAENVKGARQSGLSKAGGKVHDLLRDTNDAREDWARLSHFLYALEREAPLGGDFEEIIRRAGDRVIKHHFDYNDVSLWERNVLAKWIPFYKWMRNIIPYTIATVVTKPYALKVESGVQSVIGHMVDDDQDDNRVDYIMPDWLTYDSPVSIGSFTDENNNEFGQYMSLSMPLSDTLKKTIGPAINPLIDPATEGIGNKALAAGAGAITVGMSALNPIAKGLIQAPTGMELYPTGAAPEKGSNWLDTMMTALPGKTNLDSLVGGAESLQGVEGQNMKAWWLEQLGAINVTNNDEGKQLGALKQREDMYRTQFDKAKTNLSNMIQKKYPDTTPDQRKELVDAIVKESRKSPDSNRLGS